MKTTIRLSGLILLILLIYSCEKEQSKTLAIKTLAVTEISYTRATSGGNVINKEGTSIITIGVCWSTSPGPTIENFKTSESVGLGTFTSILTQLAMDTQYYVRAYVTNGSGTIYGNEVTFTTLFATVPILSTVEITDITETTATSGGIIESDGGEPVIERGVCWSTVQNPTTLDSKTSDSIGIGTYESAVVGLEPTTTYYARAFATNRVGSGYGNIISFTTKSPILFNPNLTYGSVTDNEGNEYKTIKIGTQVWMAENLRTTKYDDGTDIPLATERVSWVNIDAFGYCWYDNDEATYKYTSGALYNNYPKKSNICPTGWHLPSFSEWFILINYLGGNEVAGGKIRETGTNHWSSPNTGATNESGFTAIPGGYRNHLGEFNQIVSSYWWSSTRTSNPYSYSFYYIATGSNSTGILGSEASVRSGFCVRCLKN